MVSSPHFQWNKTGNKIGRPESTTKRISFTNDFPHFSYKVKYKTTQKIILRKLVLEK